MPTLITLEEFKAHLGDASKMDFSTVSSADSYLTDLLDRTEDMLERATNRTFHESGTATDEAYDGHNSDWVYVDRPIDSLTSIKVGYDPADPDETLDTFPDDAQAVEVGEKRLKLKIVRRDGGVFPSGTANLHVTYSYVAYKPTVAEQAVMEGAAYLLRRRGSEHAASTTVGQMGSTQYAALWSKLPAWRKAVGQLRKRNAA